MIKKGSACVEVFRDLSRRIAQVFGDPDKARRHKEVKFFKDICMLVEDLQRNKVHYESSVEHFIPGKPRKNSTKPPVISVSKSDGWTAGRSEGRKTGSKAES